MKTGEGGQAERRRDKGQILSGVNGQGMCGPKQKLRNSGPEPGFLSKISEESPL